MNRAAIGLVALLTSVTFLHQGRTDSNGGHYNHSTGEYHYHHGYSAHDHYDIDGDGDVDCPYTFKDGYDEYDDYGKYLGKVKNTEESETEPSNTTKNEDKANNTSKSSGNKKKKISTFAIAGIALGAIVLVNGAVDFIDHKRKKDKKEVK